MVFLEPAAELLLEEAGAEGASTEVGAGQLTIPGLEQGMPASLKFGLFLFGSAIAALAIPYVETIAHLAQKATSWIPFFGTSFSNGIQKGVQTFTNAVGRQYQGIDTEVGRGFFEIANELRLIGADVFAAAFVTFRIAHFVSLLSKKPSLAPIIQHTSKVVTVQGQKITNVTRKVVYITKVIPKAVPVHLTQQVHHLETEVHHQQAEITALREQVKHQTKPNTLTSAAAITALGLAGLGMNTARCEGTRAFQDALCEAGPQGLGRLLNLLGLGLGFIGLVELAELEQGIVHDLAGAVHDYWQV